MRKIESLRWANKCEAPDFIPSPHLRGSAAAGLRYERAFHSAVGGIRGQWFEFEDFNGAGWCQTDVILGDVIFECKLSWTWDAIKQLTWLYIPVVEKALGKKMRGVVVTRNLRGVQAVPIARSLREARKLMELTPIPVLHWLGAPAQLGKAA